MKFSKQIKILSCCILLLPFFACDYTPSGTNYNSIAVPEGKINIIVLDSNSITQLRGRVKIAIQTELDGHALKSITGYLNQIEIALSITDSNHISFQTEYYKDGNYTLTLLLSTSTNSGSMADRVGAEVFYVKKEYSVVLFNAPIKTPLIKGFSIEDGAMIINWDKYDQLCFKQYVLSKNRNVIATISDVNQTSYRDTSYIGEEAFYELTTNVLDRSLISSQRVYDSPSLNFISTSILPEDKVLLKWNKYPLTTAFGKYVITGLDSVTEITSVDDTTLIDEFPPLGPGSLYTISVFSKTGLQAVKNGEILGKPTGTPIDLTYYDFLKYIPGKNIFVRIYQDNDNRTAYISYLNGELLTLQQKQLLNYIPSGYDGNTVSDNGENIYYVYDNLAYKINYSTLLTEESTNLINLMPKGNYRSTFPIHTVKVTNSNIMAAIIIDTKGLMILAMFDMKVKKWLASLQLKYGDYYAKLQISDNGEYIILGRDIFSFDGKEIVQIGTTYPKLPFFTQDYSSVIVSKFDKIQVLRCSDLQLIKEIPGNFSNSIPNVDPKTGLCGFSGKIFDLTTGQQRGSIRISGLGSFYQNGIYFSGGYYKRVKLN